jgi:hypothetical protein
MTRADAVTILGGMKQEASAVVQSGDLASANNATKIGTIAHLLLGILEEVFPKVAPAVQVGEEVAGEVGDGVQAVTKKPNFFSELFG